ncbi:UNVERIFIED_CONTAM: hypothetical protein FKN15_046212 [Acipenser sinensis]
MAFVPTPSPTVVDQTTLMKKYLQFVAALTDNTAEETKLKMMQEVSENFENVTSSPQYSTFLEHIIPRFLTFLQDGEVQFLQEKPAQIESEENVLICLRVIIELHKQFRPQITQKIHHFLDFVKQIYKELPKVVTRYFENPQVVPDNTVPSPEMVGMITCVMVKMNPEREDSETRTHTIIPRGSLSLKVLAELPIIVVLMYQELVANYSQQMVKGMLQLLSNCPSETAHLRKELLIAAKHILTTDLRSQFIPCMDKLFESILIGSGYTARETLRPLAYSTLADLVHHVRQNLPLNDLSLAVQLFAKNIDDESLPSSIQTMSCKLLLNLVDCIRSKSEQENGNGRDILMRMLEVFVLKFHTIARYQLVTIFKKCKPQSELGVVDVGALPGVPSIPTTPAPLPPHVPPTPVTPAPPTSSFDKQGDKEDKQTFQVSDCRSLVKTLVCGVKTITWGITSCKAPGETQLIPNKQLQPKETQIYIKLVKYAMQALDIYQVQIAGNGQTYIRVANCQTVRMKEEKEVLEHFAGVFTMINPLTFKEIFQTTVPYMVDRISKNYALQIVANSFLANPSTSALFATILVEYLLERLPEMGSNVELSNLYLKLFKLVFGSVSLFAAENEQMLKIVANSFLANPSTSALFATILVEYLLERLPEMGSNVELSNLYLKLFKLVFGSVSLFAAENEQMLKPHLHKIVNSSMELAQSAKEPYNYFLLLRAVFRSIGGGSHDLLYQEFLPLLPNLLQGLNMLQSGLHKQHMKDLFVELCLTVPVRHSSLLPYLPMLMDPLVSALNGSQTLVSQGLRTLELCVDNLQPDFLYDHIQPVRAELMQALWRTLRNPADTISHVAYRVLGKFGGINRKMLKESQKLQFVVTEVPGPSITTEFSDCKASIQLPMEKAIETALDCLKSANTEPYYRRQAWEVIKCFLVAMMSLDDNKHALYQLLAHPNFSEKWIPSVIISHWYKAQDTPARKTFEQALTGAFMSAVIKDLRPSALPFVASLIRHYTMVAVAQQCGPFLLQCYQLGSQPSTAMFHSEENGSRGMDPLVLIDAIAICMAYEEKELCKIGEVALAVIFDVASIILGSKERACQLPLFSYIVERLCACCYEQAWYAKLGGVVSIKFLMERLPLIWVLQNQQTFLKALLFVMMDLTGEVSNGAVAMAKITLEQLLVCCATPLKDEEKTEELLVAQEKSFHHVTHDLVREVTSPNSTVRKQAMHSLQVLAQVASKSVTVIMEPHKEVLQDMVPPKKHLLHHQPANAQIGLMEGNTFCTTLQPRLFTMLPFAELCSLQVSNGAVAMAKITLEQLLVCCATPLKDEEKTEELLVAQEKSFHHVTHDLVREVTSPNSTVRKQAMHSLQVLAQVASKSVTVIMEPHKEVLQDMVPPKKHLLRHQPANAQIGLMEGNTFCTTLQPRLFTMDLNVVEHKVFYTELLNLCESEDAALVKLPCYKSLPSLVPLRIAALNALAACNYLPQSREKIIAALFKALNSTNNELQEAGEACMKKSSNFDMAVICASPMYILGVSLQLPSSSVVVAGVTQSYASGVFQFLEGATIEVDQIHTHMRPLLMMLGDYRSLTLNVVNRLTSVTRLFPNSFNDKFCDQMMQHLRKWMEVVVINHKGGQRSDGSEMKICSAIINLFHLIPAAPQTLVKPLLEVVMKTERAMLIESFLKHKDAKPLRDVLASNPNRFVTLLLPAAAWPGSPSTSTSTSTMRLDLQFQATKEHPNRFVTLLLPAAARPGSPSTSTSTSTMRLDLQFQAIKSFLKHKDAKPLRDVLASNPNRFVTLLLPAAAWPGSPSTSTSTSTMRLDLQFQATKIISIIVKHDEAWLAGQHSLVGQLRRVWVNEAFQERHRKDNMAATNWKEVFQGATMEYMEEEIPKNYGIVHKRALFFRFVEINDPNFGDELKSKILQHILNPAFLHSFEKGEGEQLLGPPSPEGDNPESITSVFITKVLDPEKQNDLLDSLRIYLLQFATLLVEHAPHHIHDNNKSRNSKLRRLMTFAWPCLLSKACVDPACKYSGHLLLAHIIAKFAIHKKIAGLPQPAEGSHHGGQSHRQAGHGYPHPGRPSPHGGRSPDADPLDTQDHRGGGPHSPSTGPYTTPHSTALQEYNSCPQVYYPVRHHLVQHMVSAMQRLGFTPRVTIEQRKLAADLAEVVIKWELQRIKEQLPESEGDLGGSRAGTSGATGAMKKGLSMDSGQDVKRFRTATGAVSTVFACSQSVPGADALLTKPVEKQHTDTVVSFLIKIACQVNDSANTTGSPGELLSRRCVSLMKTALRPDMWPKSELKLQWFDKLLMTVEQPSQANFANICTGLEVLSFLLTVLQSPAILLHFKPLQRGIAACMTCGNTKVLRAVHTLLSHLMSIFPTEPSTSNVASKYEELECLYAAVGKVIYEGLTNYEKATTSNSTQLFGTLMILKSACSNNPSYIDRLISVFMRSLQKMVRDHLNPQATPGAVEPSTVTSELVMLSLDLVKTRLAVMSMEMRKNFVQVILTSLIEKSPDSKILRAVVKIVEEWVKNNSPMAVNQMPNLREKSILLVKMMTYIEKRFPEDLELNAQFLDLVNYVYRDENLSGSDITSKLEPAFLSGLRCSQPLIRAKFFDVFDGCIKRRLLLAVCERGTTIGTNCQGAMLPSITNVINLADSHDRAAFAMVTHVKQEPRERENSETKEEDVEIDIELAPGDQTSTPKTKEQAEKDAGNQLHMLTNRHDKFLDSLREVKTGALLNAFVQLCHISTPLAEKTWVQLLPRLWKFQSDQQQHALSGEISPFLCSGSHQAQRDCQPSALNCFVEGMSQCIPPIPIRPCVLKYLGKTHNLWFRSTLMLEHQAFEKGLSLQIKAKQSTEFYEQESITPPQQEILDSLAELYSLLQEEDMWAGLWQKHCKFPETSTAIAYEQHGFFEQAQESYEKAMEKARKEHERNHASPAIFPEYQLWEDHWVRCSKELNQWEPLTEYGQSKGHTNPYLVLECAWRVSNWAAMKEALVQVELSCPKEMAWKVNMYRGFLAICHPEEQQLNFIERLVEMASSLVIREWRRLPPIVSHMHTPLLQAAQQIIELQEAAQINAGLQPASLGRNTSLHDMKTVVKTWRNRLPIVSDDLSHWSSIFMWRQHHYQAIVTAYENSSQHDPNSNNAMLGVHASASAIIQYGKIGRKQGLVNVALDILSRIHTIPTVPIVDCFQKIRQQVKCYLQLAGVMGKNECMQGLEVIESTNLKYFTKEMTAEFYALKGMFLSQINKSEEANKAFSAAVQMHDVLVKAWAMWGDYLENISVKDRQLHLGVSAITCYLHACRHQNESKSRKYLAKVLWLLSFDDKNTLADAVDKYCIGVPPIQWLAWIPQLLTCLVGSEGKPLLNLISQVGRVYPQAVYFPIRTLYLTLKIEQRERYKSDSSQQQPQPSLVGAQSHSASDPGPICATAPMWRCSRIMHMQRELHPTLLSSLEGIVDQMVWFRENWHEEVLRQLQQGLAKCYSVAFEKSGAVSDAKITPHTLNFVKKLVSTFGVGLENVSNVSTMFSSAASESLARRAQATAQDPVFQKMKGQFTTDFDFSVPGSMKLHNLISKLKKWIKILEAKTKQLPKFFLIEKCRFLSNFSAQTAEVEIPGEFLMPKPMHYYIKIARFMPRVEIVQKHNTAARRLYIRGHNGKIYPYLVMNDACLTESRRDERVLQLLRLVNPCLEKRKETTKRHLLFTDFDFSVPGSMKLHDLISKLKKWIKILEAKTKQLPKFFLIEEKCRFLSNLSAQTAEVEIPGEFLMPKPTHYYIKIARFMPRVEIVQKHNTAARRLYIRGHNGKIYPYLVMNDACLTESRREERVLQLLRLLNPCLEKRKETTKRHLLFTDVQGCLKESRKKLVSHCPAVSLQVLRDILKEVQGNMVPRSMLKEWALHTFPNATDYWTFRKMFTIQLALIGLAEFVLHLNRLNPEMLQIAQVLREILKEVQGNMVPRSMLKEWALHTFPNATDYWTFCKMFTIQLALIGLAEFVLHLNRLNPEMLQIAQDTGKLNVAYFRFDINDATGDLDANRPVPFRLTPNISEFLTTIGVSGPLTASMIAVARCFAQPNFKPELIDRLPQGWNVIHKGDTFCTLVHEIHFGVIINLETWLYRDLVTMLTVPAVKRFV